MQKGDAYVMLGSTYHAGGANKTESERRTLHGLFFSRGYLRSEVSPAKISEFTYLKMLTLTRNKRKTNTSSTKKMKSFLGLQRSRG